MPIRRLAREQPRSYRQVRLQGLSCGILLPCLLSIIMTAAAASGFPGATPLTGVSLLCIRIVTTPLSTTPPSHYHTMFLTSTPPIIPTSLPPLGSCPKAQWSQKCLGADGPPTDLFMIELGLMVASDSCMLLPYHSECTGTEKKKIGYGYSGSINRLAPSEPFWNNSRHAQARTASLLLPDP